MWSYEYLCGNRSYCMQSGLLLYPLLLHPLIPIIMCKWNIMIPGHKKWTYIRILNLINLIELNRIQNPLEIVKCTIYKPLLHLFSKHTNREKYKEPNEKQRLAIHMSCMWLSTYVRQAWLLKIKQIFLCWYRNRFWRKDGGCHWQVKLQQTYQ